MWVEEEIQRIAAGQHSVITRTQLIAVGATDHEILGHIRRGRIEQNHDGVYYLDSTPATWLTEMRSALFTCGPDAIASHRCAAVLWGLDGIRGKMIEITVPYVESPEPPGAVVHRTRRLNPSTMTRPIPINTVEKNFLDLASMLPERVLWKAGRSAVRKGLTTAGRLDQTIGLLGGRGVAGTRLARRVVEVVADDQSASVSEIDLIHIVRGAPVPHPVQQLQVRLPDGTNVYRDFA